jgi:hypothetical protein
MLNFEATAFSQEEAFERVKSWGQHLLHSELLTTQDGTLLQVDLEKEEEVRFRQCHKCFFYSKDLVPELLKESQPYAEQGSLKTGRYLCEAARFPLGQAEGNYVDPREEESLAKIKKNFPPFFTGKRISSSTFGPCDTKENIARIFIKIYPVREHTQLSLF